MIAERLEQRQLLSANQPVQLIDDTDPGFVATEQWDPYSHSNHYRDQGHILLGDESGTASWTFTVAPGKYQVSSTWYHGPNRSQQAPYVISGGVGGDVPVTVNQEIRPIPHAREYVDGTEYRFQHLGDPVEVAGNTLTVTLRQPETLDPNQSAFESGVAADAIRIEPVADVREQIIDEFNAVYENVELEFYTGIKKGPQATEESRSGNDWDQAALLVDKIQNNSDLVAAGVTARIVRGLITVSNDELKAWVGAPEIAAAKEIVADSTGTGENWSDDTAPPKFHHTWVQVNFPTGTDTQSVRLDPSWKIRQMQPGIRLQLPGDQGSFDEFGYLAEPGSQLPIEYYEDRVMDHLVAQGQGRSLADVPRTGPILTRSFADGLVTDPHLSSVGSHTSWANFTAIVNNGTLRERYTHRVRIQVGTRLSNGDFVGAPLPGGGYDNPFSRTITIPESSLDTFAIKRTPSGFIYRVNGSGSQTRALTVASGASQQIVLTHAIPGESFSDVDEKRKFEHDASKPNGHYIISIGAGQFSNQELDDRRAAINAVAANGAHTADIDEVLNYISARYWYQFDKYRDQAGRLMHARFVNNFVGSGVVFADDSLVRGDYSFQQVPIVPDNAGVDYPNASSIVYDLHYAGLPGSNRYHKEAFQLAGYTGSALEHAVLEEVLHSDSISTAQGLKDAFAGDPTLVGTPSNSVWIVESVDDVNASGVRKVYLRGEIGDRADEGTNSLPYLPNQTGMLVNEQQFLDRFSGHRSEDGRMSATAIGATNLAIYSGNTLIDHGYIMYSEQRVHDRFAAGTVNANNSDHLIIVDYTPTQGGSGWHRYNNYTGLWSPFVPRETDVLLAKVDFSNDAILTTYARSGALYGIQYASGRGDLTFTAGAPGNWKHGKFFATGTHFGYPIPNNSDTNRNIAGLWQSLTDPAIVGTATALVPQEPSFAGNALSNWGGTVYVAARKFESDSLGRHSYIIAPYGDGAAINGGRTGGQVAKNFEVPDTGNLFKNSAGDPVDVLNGNMFRDEVDIAYPNIGVPLDFARHYDSQSKYDVGLGRGWVHSFSDRILQPDGVSNELKWLTSEGTLHTFNKESGVWVSPSGLLGVFKQTSDGFVYKSDDGIEHHFFKTDYTTSTNAGDSHRYIARLSKIIDRHGNGVQITYKNTTNGFDIKNAQDIHDTYARQLYFTVVGTRITNIAKYSAWDNSIGRKRIADWEYTYIDSNNNGKLLHLVTNAEQEQIRFEYNSKDTISRITEPDASYHAYQYYPNGRTFRVTEGVVQGTTYTPQSSHSFNYDQRRNLTEFIDENGNVETYIHQDTGQLVRHVHDDRTRVITKWGMTTGNAAYDHNDDGLYDGSENLQTRITDETGAIETFKYYACTHALPDCSDPNEAFLELQLRSATEKHFPGQTPTETEFYYRSYHGGRDHIVDMRSIIVDPAGSGFKRTTTYQYDGQGRLQQQTDPLGNIVTYDYYIGSLLPEQTYLENLVRVQHRYEPGADLNSDPALVTTEFQYDQAGQVVSASTLNPGTGTPLPTTVTTYQHTGAVEKVVGATGVTMTWDLDHLGRQKSATEQGGSASADDITRQFFYDGQGRLIRSIDALNRETNLLLDRRGNLLRRDNPDGSVELFEYDAVGNLIAAVDPVGRETRFRYDGRNRLIQTQFPDGSLESVRYDGLGRVAARFDALGRETQFQYDERGLLVESRFAVGSDDEAITSNTYNAFGELVQTIDGNGNVTQFIRDALGRETKRQVLDKADNGNPNHPSHVPALVVTTGYDDRGNTWRTVVYDVAALSGQQATLLSDDPRALITSHPNDVQVTETEYDVRNRPVKTIHADGEETRIEYDDAGRVEFQYDELDRKTELVYDVYGRLKKRILPDPDGPGSENPLRSPEIEYEYDVEGNRTAVIDANGHRTEFEFDALNRLVATTDALTHRSETRHDLAGQVIMAIDALGRITRTTYDQRGRVESVTLPDPDGDGAQVAPVNRFEYDAVGNQTKRIDANGIPALFNYDDLNRLHQETIAIVELDEFGNPVGTVQSAARFSDYDNNGNLVASTDTLGRTTEYTYDSLDRQITVTTPDPDGGGYLNAHRTVMTYDGFGNVIGSLESRGEDFENESTFGDNLSSERRAAWTYDDRNRVLTKTFDANRTGQVTTSYVYDAAGNLLEQSRFGSSGPGVATTWNYDNLNRVVRETVYSGGSSTFVGANNLPHATFFHYDAVGNLTRTTEQILFPTVSSTEYPALHTDYKYDKLNRQTKIIRDAEGGLESTTEFVFDAVGNLRYTTDALNRVSENRYDALDRLIQSIGPDPDGPVDPLSSEVTTFTYDAVGHLLTQENGEGETDRFVYDSLGRLIRSFDAVNAETIRRYDSESNLLEYTDPELNTTTYSHDRLNRLKRETIVLDDGDPGTNDERSREYRYDARGNIDRIWDRNGRERRMSYDRFDRRIKEIWIDPTGPELELTWDYDAFGRVTRSQFDGDSNHQVETFEYDGLGRITAQRNYDPADLTLTTNTMVEQRYVHDLWVGSAAPDFFASATNYSQQTTTDGLTFMSIGEMTVLADRLGRTTMMLDHAQSANGSLTKRITLTHDAADQLVNVERNGVISGGDVFDTGFVYDSAGRLQSISHATGSSTPTPISSYAYQYDQAGRVVNQTTSFNQAIPALAAEAAVQSEDFGFDDAGQLQSDADRTYQYDQNGNRDSSTTTIDAYNRLTSDAEYSYQYDGEGNLVLRTANDGTYTEYDWDYRNALKTVKHFLADGTQMESIRYRYNASGQLVDRLQQSYGSGAPPAEHSTLVYNGTQLALSHDGSSGELQDRYLWAPGVDQLLANEVFGEIDGVGGQFQETLWAANDHLGTINQLIDSQQTVVEHRQYDSFGNITEVYGVTGTSNDAVDTVFAFAGRRHDEASGLYYNRARWHDPTSGRFIGTDPAGHIDGPNLYTYAGNDPINFVDPSGLNSAHPLFGRGQGVLKPQYQSTGVLAPAKTSNNTGSGSSKDAWANGLTGGLYGAATHLATANAFSGGLIGATNHYRSNLQKTSNVSNAHKNARISVGNQASSNAMSSVASTYDSPIQTDIADSNTTSSFVPARLDTYSSAPRASSGTYKLYANTFESPSQSLHSSTSDLAYEYLASPAFDSEFAETRNSPVSSDRGDVGRVVFGAYLGLSETGRYLSYPARLFGIDFSERDRIQNRLWDDFGSGSDSSIRTASQASGLVATAATYGAAAVGAYGLGASGTAEVTLTRLYGQSHVVFGQTGSPLFHALGAKGKARIVGVTAAETPKSTFFNTLSVPLRNPNAVSQFAVQASTNGKTFCNCVTAAAKAIWAGL